MAPLDLWLGFLCSLAHGGEDSTLSDWLRANLGRDKKDVQPGNVGNVGF